MLLKIEKPRHIKWPRQLYFKQLFNTEEVILQQPREDRYFISILPRQQNIADLFPLERNEVCRSVTSFF